jgi:hypothetical protein
MLPLVVVLQQAERLDTHTLSSVVEQLQEAFVGVRVVLLLFHSSFCSLPFPLLGGE